MYTGSRLERCVILPNIQKKDEKVILGRRFSKTTPVTPIIRRVSSLRYDCFEQFLWHLFQ